MSGIGPPFPGMTLVVGGLEVVDGQLGVMFEGVQSLVTQEFFDVVEVGGAPVLTR